MELRTVNWVILQEWIVDHLPKQVQKLLEQTELYQYVRSILIAGVFLFSLVVVPYTFVSGRTSLSLVAMLPIALMGGLFFMRWTDLGFPLMIIVGLVVPFEISTGTQTRLNGPFLISGALFGIWIFKMFATREFHLRPLSRTFRPALGIIITTIIAFGFGQLPWFPVSGASMAAQLGGAILFILSSGIFLVVCYNTIHIVILRWMVGVFIFLGGIYVISNLVPQIGQYTARIYQPGALQSLFWLWLAVLSFTQSVLNRRLPFLVRILLGLITVITVYITWVQKRTWISGWLPVMIGLAICLFAIWPRLGLLGGILVLIAILYNAQAAESTVMIGDNEYSLMTRLEAWRIMFRISLMNPLFGLGPANYYWYTMLFPILGYNVVFNSHNNYIDILGQTGLVGLFFFLWFHWENGWMLWRSLRTLPFGFENAFLFGCFGGLGGTLVAAMLGDWVIPFVYNVGYTGFRTSMLPWLFLGGAAAVVRQMIPAKANA